MPRLVPSILLLALVVAGDVLAEDIRCRVPSGTVVITDEPAAVPPDCKKMPPPTAGTLSVVPTTPPDTAATERYLQGVASGEEQRRKHLDQMTQEANTLAADYLQALADIYNASYTEDTLAIGRRIERLKARKTEILGDLATVNPSPEEEAAVKTPLATIPP